MTTANYLPTGQRHFGLVNWLGLWTLYRKEVRRFLKVGIQTVLAPVVSTLLFLVIFKLALGRARPDIDGVPFANFLAPGLIMLAILTNCFANTSSSILMAKIQGNLVDVLMPPLAPWELAIGYIMGGVTRGVIVAVATGLTMLPFVDLSIAHVWSTIYFGLVGCFLLSEIGVLAGIWADKFDHMAVITNFVVMPLVFLSGTFYSVRMLPEYFYLFSQWNPIFYLIDGFRYGVVDHADGSIAVGAVSLLVLTVALGWASYYAFHRGWKLKT